MRDTLPSPGLGTWANDDPEQCAETVRTALRLGYRHVDTAQMYGNETAVGRGLATADVPREDVVLATKIAPGNLGPGDVRATAVASADRLGVDVIDLLYVHWPLDAYDPDGTLGALADLRDQGLVRHIGVSNFEPDQLAVARNRLDAPLAVHQIEFHPLLDQADLLEEAGHMGHHLVAYSPLARGAALEDPTIRSVAASSDATPAQVCLAWAQAKGAVPIPKATGEDHLRENWDASELTLDQSALARIDGIEREERVVDFGAAPWNR